MDYSLAQTIKERIDEARRITFFGNCGTIYSIMWLPPEIDGEEQEETLPFGEWEYPFNDNVIEALIDDILSMCRNAFLEEEDIFKVVISEIEIERISTVSN